MVAKDLRVRRADAGEKETVTIQAGETVRLIPEYAAAPVAHLVWNGERFVCDRSLFLSSSSPIGHAPD